MLTRLYIHPFHDCVHFLMQLPSPCDGAKNSFQNEFFSHTYKSTWNIPEHFSQHHKDGVWLSVLFGDEMNTIGGIGSA
jgi:hypothetical protein